MSWIRGLGGEGPGWFLMFEEGGRGGAAAFGRGERWRFGSCGGLAWRGCLRE